MVTWPRSGQPFSSACSRRLCALIPAPFPHLCRVSTFCTPTYILQVYIYLTYPRYDRYSAGAGLTVVASQRIVIQYNAHNLPSSVRLSRADLRTYKRSAGYSGTLGYPRHESFPGTKREQPYSYFRFYNPLRSCIRCIELLLYLPRSLRVDSHFTCTHPSLQTALDTDHAVRWQRHTNTHTQQSNVLKQNKQKDYPTIR